MMPKEMRVFNPGERLPDFSLPSTLGHPIRISDFRNRSNLVVIFSNPEELEGIQSFFAELDRAAPELVEENTQVVLVLPVAIEEAERRKDQFELTSLILADEHRQVIDDLIHVHQPGTEMYILDRFGEIYAVERIETGGYFPPAKEIIAWVRFIEIHCPE
jgi:peroxiredoxin